MRYAVAISEHPEAAVATAEVVGQVLDRLDSEPDLAILFTTPHHIASIQTLTRTVQSILGAGALLGATAVSVLAHRQEVEQKPAIVLWAGITGECQSIRLAGGQLQLPAIEAGSSILLLADPFTCDAAELLSGLSPEVNLIGGLASASSRPGGNRLVLDDATYEDGATAVVIPPSVQTRTVVSQGCRPVGEPFTVTAAQENHLLELGGKSAVNRLRTLISNSDEKTRTLISRGLHIGLVMNESRDTFEFGDFLIRAVTGIDQSRGTITIGDHATIGSTVQFQVRDAETASTELQALLRPLEAQSALVFTCNGRGSHLFGRPGHDAESFAEGLSTSAIAGMFCAGEIGPVGHRHFLHGFTASSLLFEPKTVS